jgi:7-carboxy-7-deazaguanine synthase
VLTRAAMATDSLVIHEIYRSIQGETSFAGRPCTLVRLSGCNLRCRWCDTTQAFNGGTRMTREEVLQKALDLATPLVLVTGGEPLLQPAAIPLLRDLCEAGKTVLLETSGERDISAVDPRVHRIVDMKAPGSGEVARNRYENLALLGPRDQLKFVLADREDYVWARGLIDKAAVIGRVGEVLLSPVHGELDPRELVAWTLEDTLNVRVQLQLHKYIWGRDVQGV